MNTTSSIGPRIISEMTRRDEYENTDDAVIQAHIHSNILNYNSIKINGASNQEAVNYRVGDIAGEYFTSRKCAKDDCENTLKAVLLRILDTVIKTI